ncbi:DEKNAAC102115 [Brettanomyces naardenensis]|uniref:non-specific serine/threonine protein kinase n=1 Tax=Brettanomyces naardenensis TaxID=13370 RepID=A0A448YJV2_BRENA|nr:DEKNAAC102115 [Brettanomyces naardenensis]
MSRKPEPVTRFYRRLEVVGRGKFGTVYKGLDLSTKKLVALKVLNLDTEEDEVREVQKEIQFLSQLKSVPNVTRYHGSYLNGHNLWIVMDYCAGGSVRTLLKPGPLEELHISVIARELLHALKFVHENGVIHRDIKAANILISKDGHVQLSDFGVAAQLTSTALKRTTMAGTPYWMAPEVITEGTAYNVKADIWSFGITIYEMATGNPPYGDKDAMRALQMITHHEPPRLEGRQYSNLLKEFVAMCLEEKPDLRPSAAELLKSRFIKAYRQTSTATLKEVIGRYLIWRDKRTSRDSLYLEEEAQKAQNVRDDDQSYDVKWDFDSLKSAEYIVENEIEVDDLGTATTNSNFHTPTTYHTYRELTMTTSSPYQQRTLGAGAGAGAGAGTATIPGTPTTPATTVVASATSSSFFSPAEPPKSLLKLFKEGESDDEESGAPEDDLLLMSNNTSSAPTPVGAPGALEMAPVPEESPSIEIPTMETLETAMQRKMHTRSRAATVTASQYPQSAQTQPTQPIQPQPTYPLPSQSTYSASPSLPPSSLPPSAPHRSSSAAEFRPEAVRRPTLTTASNGGRRTPSPKKATSGDTSLRNSPLRVTMSPPHMKPLTTANSQPLLQPINTTNHSGINTGPQTAPPMMNNELYDQQQQQQQQSAPTTASLVRARSQKRLQMPAPMSFGNPDIQNSPERLNQFGVNINLASNIPLAMTPVAEKNTEDLMPENPDHQISTNTNSNSTFVHAHNSIPEESAISELPPSHVNHRTQPPPASQLASKLAELHVMDAFDFQIPGSILGEPEESFDHDDNVDAENSMADDNIGNLGDDKDAIASEVFEMFGKIRDVLGVVVEQMS